MKQVLNTRFRLIGTSGIDNNLIELFSTSSSGTVSFLGTNKTYTLEENKFLTFSIVVDFENGKLHFYDSEGSLIVSNNFKAPTGENVSSTLEWQGKITNTVFNWRNNGATDSANGASLGIGSIEVTAGNIFAK